MRATDYSQAVKKELAFKAVIEIGAEGIGAKRVQEWLTFHQFGVSIDAKFGTATAAAVTKFQLAKGLQGTGIVDQDTWNALTDPVRQVLKDGAGQGFRARITSLLMQHLRVHPLELGGDNCGPWVRIYNDGDDGTEQRWCAGFVSFILRQAAAELARNGPVAGDTGCDEMVAQAKQAGLFVTEKQLLGGQMAWSDLGPLYLFFCRKSPGDWTHVGFGFGGSADVFDSIEGNGNHSAGENSYEVCSRTRSGVDKDYMIIPD
ncbi:MAG: peptidoglycan-binding protein [Burkholderiaceae bacterium]|nr:peptidoglycan-binding protein [Burkholderiaceae bacterium]